MTTGFNPETATWKEWEAQQRTFYSQQAALEYAKEHPEIKGSPKNARFKSVRACMYCPTLFWGTAATHTCPECRAKEDNIDVDMYIDTESEYKPRVTPNTNVSIQPKKETKEERQARLRADANRTVFEENKRLCCEYYDGVCNSTICKACMKGVSLLNGTKTVSSRRCPENPIATDGSRYIQRATYRKDTDNSDSNSTKSYYDYADNLPEHLKVQLVKRMQRMGRDIQLCSDGHVGSPDDGLRCGQLREVQQKYQQCDKVPK